MRLARMRRANVCDPVPGPGAPDRGRAAAANCPGALSQWVMFRCAPEIAYELTRYRNWPAWRRQQPFAGLRRKPRTRLRLKPKMGVEPTTPALRKRCSAIELLRRRSAGAVGRRRATEGKAYPRQNGVSSRAEPRRSAFGRPRGA